MPLKLQSKKALVGISVNASDNLRLVNSEQQLKADSPIVVTELGNVKSPVNPVQSQKALSPIVFRLLDSVRVPLNPVHPLKALLPISVTEFGMTRFPERLVQYLYLQPIITQYFIDNKSEIWLLFLIAHSKR